MINVNNIQNFKTRDDIIFTGKQDNNKIDPLVYIEIPIQAIDQSDFKSSIKYDLVHNRLPSNADEITWAQIKKEMRLVYKSGEDFIDSEVEKFLEPIN